jgi:HEAT repeat protein
MARRRTALLLLLLALPAAAAADVIPVGGKALRGTWWEDGDQVVVNPYNSTNRAMTWGVERFPKAKVNLAKVKPTETPEEEYCRRAFAIREGGAAEHAELARWCAERKLADLAAREWERVLESEPSHEEARKALGPSGVKEVLRRNGKANPALGELLAQYLAAESPATRLVLRDRLKRDHDWAAPAFFLERAWRSARKPKGRTDDVKLSFRSDRVKGEAGAVYTLFVPASYDPLRPAPLLVGLHGGGRGGKDGKEVVGSGPSAMNFYTGIAESRGWIVLCPTAIQAPWDNPVNVEFLDSCLEEIQLLYNVDLHRVYLTGHSMGGFGSWHYGPLWAERWAGVAPMAGGGGPGLPRLQDTQTPVFVFHGADDNVVGVAGDRAAANSLRDSGHDFVYTELNGVGHGLPQEVAEEMAAYFEVKRLAVGKGKAFRRSDAILSSFLGKPTKEEKRYLGDPEPPDPDAKGEAPEAKRKRLLAEIDLGGGKAEAAAAAFEGMKDPEAVKALGARLANVAKVPDDVRQAAAKGLGALGTPDAVPFLERGLGDENDGVFHAVLASLGSIADRKAGPALLRALDFQAKRFDGKRQGGGMDFPDYEGRCAALGAAAEAAAALADPKGAAEKIRDAVVATVFEKAPRVPELARAGHFPGQVREALGKRIAAALGQTGSPAAADGLRRLKEAAKGDAGIVAACDEALAALPAAPAAPGKN